MSNFQAIKDFQKALNDTTIMNRQIVLNTVPPKKTINQATKKILAKIFLPKES